MATLAPIIRLVCTARRRLVWSAALGGGAHATVAAGVGLLAFVASWKAFAGALGFDAGGATALAVAVSIVVAVIGVAGFTRALRERRVRGDLAVASLLDVRMGLHDRLSTALAVADRADPFAQAARASGVSAATDRRIEQGIAKAVPIAVPPRWWMGPGISALAIVLWLVLPSWDWSAVADAASSTDAELDAARRASTAQVETLEMAIKENPQLAQAMADTATANAAMAEKTNEDLRTPEDIRRETTRQVNELSKRLDDVLNSEKAMQMDALKDALRRIEPSKDGPLGALSEALKRADAQAAKRALEQLRKLADSPELSESARKELGQQLDQLASQVESAAQSGDTLRKALEAAGLDGDLAKSADAARKAIDSAKGLNEAQKEALRKALSAQQNAAKQLEKVAKACKALGSQCNKPGSAKDGAASACQSASEALSEAETLSEMLKDAECARGQCQSACRSSAAGESAMNSPGGLGAGGERTKEETATGTKLRKERVAVNGGDVIARQLVDAPPLQGESRAKVERLSGEIGKGYEEGTEDDPVPAALRDVHKRYFGDLKRAIDQKSGKDASPSSAPVPTSGK